MRAELESTVDGSTGSDSWSTTEVVVDTLVAPSGGSTLRTVGWGVQAASPMPTKPASRSARVQEEENSFTNQTASRVARRWDVVTPTGGDATERAGLPPSEQFVTIFATKG